MVAAICGIGSSGAAVESGILLRSSWAAAGPQRTEDGCQGIADLVFRNVHEWFLRKVTRRAGEYVLCGAGRMVDGLADLVPGDAVLQKLDPGLLKELEVLLRVVFQHERPAIDRVNGQRARRQWRGRKAGFVKAEAA